mmetsp:Transcript_56603/g.120187  ORF Transcript_56603/g.120187 Transcript_56603/m.120187 type:complete len:85 (-) Transcript_56603:419-673(-)|eukprot:CAMPEP_0172553610 /NCGR_PEP_ID=MMETSP1067-20121228/51307_1 /TAXON_ID=265564 ORGANISM="Thalassiosira punctigera, Strain Tpunct2005C2" /NCGR_SAMPLE_ID=MMETSP1067 /ASSEMBLY_ACC=CAM_ASM_000444 /LENGTH=84 /DNA_ID=CAMNT_0013341825 /DNA_START=228 /DNA_END=482 /DNA_ORIENTATION=+
MADSTPSFDKTDYRTYHGTEGSWAPTLLLIAFLAFRYLSQNSVKFQRFVSNQRIHWRKKLGYRDESKYQMGVGDGANLELKRQG